MPRFIEKGTKTPEDTAFLMGTNADGVDGKYSQAALKHYFIDEEVEARKKADEEEKAAREAADTALGGRIDAETTARKKADEEEKAAREAADTVLGGRIDAEATARTNGDAASNAAAAAAQSTADSAAIAIAAEQTARANADSAINTKIGDLGSLTTSAKGTLVAAINEAAKSGGSGDVPMGTSAVAGIVRITDNSGSQSTAADSIAISPKAVSKGYAQKNHASTSEDFGIATNARFGHVKLNHNLPSGNDYENVVDGIVPSMTLLSKVFYYIPDVVKTVFYAKFLVTDADTAQNVRIDTERGRIIAVLYTASSTSMSFYNDTDRCQLFMLFRWPSKPVTNPSNTVASGTAYVMNSSGASLAAAGTIKARGYITLSGVSTGWYTLITI